jgi:fucose permease
LRQALFKKHYAWVTWICAFFLLGYVGIEVALGGWIVTFMMRVRNGEAFASGMTATGFWLGITFGRVVLGFITPKLGEKLAITVSVLTALQLLPLLFPTSPKKKEKRKKKKSSSVHKIRPSDILALRNSRWAHPLARA